MHILLLTCSFQDELVNHGTIFLSLAKWLQEWQPLAAQRVRIGAALDVRFPSAGQLLSPYCLPGYYYQERSL